MPRVLVSGLCSVGKSSFVSALWGDAELLPTAVRDCTQTNTLIRAPRDKESERQILLKFLSREEALKFAAGGLAFYRIATTLKENLGIDAPAFDEFPLEERLRTALSALKKLHAERPQVLVLNEFLTDEMAQLEEFLRFLDSSEFKPNTSVPARWEDRRELLMGRRTLDGRTENVGKLWALRHVELIRTPANSQNLELIDTPWIPAFHNARRTELVLDQARQADALIILSLPQRYEPEEWVIKIFRERPALAKRTLIVFNQIDTVDSAALFAREGFAQAFDENAARLSKFGVDPNNLFMSCARLPFLSLMPPTDAIDARIAKLKSELQRLGKLAASRPESPFKTKFTTACNSPEGGIPAISETLTKLLQ